jgi:hypothetical protein
MPYEIKEQDGKFAVIEKDTGKVIGSPHETRPKAEAHLRALYANVSDANKSGARNSMIDIERLRKIRALLDELDPMGEDQPDLGLGSEKSFDSYAKSIGLSVAPDILAVKSISQDEIKGYAMLWGGPKITDLETEYFTKSTDFWDAQLGKSPRPLTWDHAQDDAFKADPRIGVITDFGDDDVGRFYVARLDRSHRYRKAVDALIAAGKLGTSSDSAPQYVERVQTGKSTWLKTWPFFAAALTDCPAEPRMIGSIDYLKSIGVCLPDAPKNWAWQTARMKRLRLLS